MCGFYMNELLLRLLPREDAHEILFEYYAKTMQTLSNGVDFATTLRRFELKLLQELGYAVPLLIDENALEIVPENTYRYEAEYGASELKATKNGVQLSGKTLLDMAQDDYADSTTQSQSKQLMRYLLAHYLGDKPLHTRQLLIDLQTI
jgi:DNA repair protein RecO (recombination protein O)